MKLRDSFKLSVNSILHRKLRSWLTLLGIIIGVAAVVSIVSIGDGAQAQVNERLSGFGADILTVSAGSTRTQGFGGIVRGGGPGSGGEIIIRSRTETGSQTEKEPVLTLVDVRMLRGNSNVLAVNPIVSGREELAFLAEKTNTSIQGVNPNAWKTTSNIELASGRLLTSSDSSAIVISDRLANSTFKQPLTLGRTVTINEKSFTIVGILKATSSGSAFGGSGDSTAYMNYTSAWDVTDVNRDTFSSIQVKVSDPNQIDQIVAELTQTLQLSRKVTERNQDFSITSAKAIQEQISSVTQTLTLFLGAIAMVSLLVGAIGIANSMFTSVLEKTREIGIMKALGATNNEILRLFLIESGLFGFVGGTIGAIVGTIVSLGFNMLGARLLGMGTTVTMITPQLIFAAIVLSTFIGVVSGLMPARAASKLRPIEALRYE
ncbi:MAG: ABC transporter permease [Candidatus Diapherotrites archaeon]|uniref:ABC transporter permease n=1 Tax=Candidatus Iainarchaeum sp. TaxID=3101447 RepID=A0A8T4L4G6_9ARCH|nr:ABC transporter permease [Candidatus Diapherotrites archaeon]